MDLLKWAAVCLVIALVSWVFGYSRYATGTASLAKFLFLVLFVTILILSLIGVEFQTPPI